MKAFTPEQVLAILNEIGIHVTGETGTVWTCLCPFHANTESAAFSVNKSNGLFYCFNESCNAQGNIESLVMNTTGKNMFASLRLIDRVKANKQVDVTSIIKKNIEEDKLPTFSRDVLDKMYVLFWKNEEAQDYMFGRGFTKETLKHYRVGYSPKKKLVVVPMYDNMGEPVGVIGRAINSKRFRNSNDLPKSKTLWNIHNAKRSPKVVITEASFDAMRVWQATGIESVACLGSQFSAAHAAQIDKYFTHVVIMTDDDQKLTTSGNCRRCKTNGHDECIGHNTGLELGHSIAEASRGLTVTWAHLDSLKRFDGMKDAGDMTDDQIRYSIDNAVSNIEINRMYGSVV